MNGSYKGYAGECMFKLTKTNAIIPRFSSLRKHLFIFGKKYTQKQYEFIQKNWWSIDSFEMVQEGKNEVLTMYKIKTRNSYKQKIWNPPKMTKYCHEMYSEAEKLGFRVKMATVWLDDNWEYRVVIEDFGKSEYYIDDQKRYDNSKSSDRELTCGLVKKER